MKLNKARLTLWLLFFSSLMSLAQSSTITGNVTDSSGLPLPGVNVVIDGTNTGTQTDFDGFYTIDAQVGQKLVFSYLGLKTTTVTVQTGRTTINVQMEDNAEVLQEVVVVGYGSKAKELSTSAVSTVSASEISDFVPSTSVDNILQGKAAGVQITAANGRPGQTAFVQIRGVGSINASTNPLYVVDGVPINVVQGGTNAAGVVVNINPLNNINPNDIESVSILKDAATISKFGSRGANGVVVITTKNGKSGDAQITFRSSIGTGERIPDPFDLMNASQKLELERQFAELGVNAAQSLPGASSTPEQLEILRSLDTNWEEELLRKSFIQSNSLSVSGGDEKLTYFMSLGYDKNTGIIDRIDGFERISARLNTTYQAKKWLNIGLNVSASRSSTDLPRDRNNVQNPFRGLYDYNPYEPLFLRDASGDFVLDNQGERIFNPTSTGFPVARALLTEPEDNRNFLLISNLSADMTLSSKFSNRFSVGLTNNRFNRTFRSIAGGVLQGFIGDVNFPGLQTDNFSNDFTYNVNNIFSYNDTYGEKHNVGLSFLLEYNENIFTDLFATSRGFPSPDIAYQDVAAEPISAGTEERRRILFSQGLFLDYDFDQKYIVSGSIRRDGSSRFGPDNKYGYFYSGSLAWNISKEKFMEDSVFNNLRLRASYGTSGNDNIGDFNFLNLLNFQTYNGLTTAIPVGVGNPAVQWESQAILDIGLEFGLFNNRVNGVIDYFKKTSDDLLLDRPISQTVGDENNSILSNIGKVENSGLEISINADVIRNANFLWSMGANVAFLDNEVKSLVNGEDIVQLNTILREGEEINSFNLVQYAGVDPTNGEPLYLDENGNVTNEFSSSFETLLEGKSPAANVEGGFYSSFKYGGLSLRGDFAFRAGNYILNSQRQQGVLIGNIDSNLRVEAFNYWQQPGDENVLPSPLFAATADQTSTRFLEKGDFLRLRTLTLAYDVPRKFFEKTGLTNVRIYGTGQNLWTLTDYNGDPEIGIGSAETAEPGDPGFVPGERSLFSYPQTRSYTFGIDIGF